MDSVIIKDPVAENVFVEIKIGDWVSFKSDIEQSGEVIAIRRSSSSIHKPQGIELVLENENGFIGEYIGGDTKTVVRLKDIWVD